VSRSGNPGYILGLPLLVAGESGNSMVYYPGGFEIKGFNSFGKCTTRATNTDNMDSDNPILRFGTDLSYGCQLEAKTESELEAFCMNPNL